MTYTTITTTRYTTALSHNLVKPIPTRSNLEDLDPELLVFPVDYQSPSAVLAIVKENEVGMKILSDHIEVKQKRHTALLREVTQLQEENAKFDSILLKINQDLAVAENELRSISSELQASISSTIDSLSNSTTLLSTHSDPEIFSSPIDTLLTQSAEFTSLLSTFSKLISPLPPYLTPSSSISKLEIEELALQTAKLESKNLFNSTKESTLESVASNEFESFSTEELELLLVREETKTLKIESVFTEYVEKRVKDEIERSVILEKVRGIERTISFITMLKSSAESELALLIHTYNSLSRTHDTLINFQILALALISILQETTSLATSPLPTVAPSKTDSSPSSTNKISEALLFKAVENLSRVPILNKDDLRAALEEVEDRYWSRITQAEVLDKKNQEASLLLKAHLNLYSPTSILSTISKPFQELISLASLKEREWKSVLAAEEVKSVQVANKKDRESFKRLELILREG